MKYFMLVAMAVITFTPFTYALDDPTEHDKAQVSSSFKKAGYSPYAGRNFPTQVVFGDTHLHSAASGDAFGFGNKINDEEALRFARGAEITSAHGKP